MNHKPLIASIGSIIPLQWMRMQNNLPPFLPFYHTVNNSPYPFVNSYCVRDEKTFERELDYLLRFFKPVDLQTIVQTQGKNLMHLSFDDGMSSCPTIIAPILKRKGIPATFFICPEFVDNRALFHRCKRAWLQHAGILSSGGKRYFHYETTELDQLAIENNIDWLQILKEHTPYMTLEEIKALQNDGFTLGAHSIDHPEFWLLNEEEQYRQVSESMAWVEDKFNPSIRAFAFPFTDDGVRLSLFQRLQKEKITDVTFGTAGLKHDLAPGHYQRIPMERISDWSARKVVHFEFFYYFVRSLLNKNTVMR